MALSGAGGIAHGSSAAYREIFGMEPEVGAEAPGRVNLLGEHTDYNEGFVLPTLLPYVTRVEAGRTGGTGSVIEAYAESAGELLRCESGDRPAGTWLDYVAGCFWALDQAGLGVPGGRLYIHRGVPMGVGLASSAALEVAVLRALRALYGIPLDDVRLALIGHRAEVEYVGIRCGVMDQIVASLGRVGDALFLDTRSLRSEPIALQDEYRFVVVDSGVPRSLAEVGYNQRRAECEQAAAQLSVRALRDLALDDLDRLTPLPEPLQRRVRHVVTENARVLAGVEALKRGHAGSFGRFMLDSHRSLREDFEVSIPELDQLVDLAMEHSALGARLTGAGFGGCIVAMVAAAAADGFTESVSRQYPKASFYHCGRRRWGS